MHDAGPGRSEGGRRVPPAARWLGWSLAVVLAPLYLVVLVLVAAAALAIGAGYWLTRLYRRIV